MRELSTDPTYWEPRDCFVEPLPEHEEAAELFDKAGQFLLRGDAHAALDCVGRTDIPKHFRAATCHCGGGSLSLRQRR